ncbi:MAG TPA: hypothetical protein VGW37_18200 [Terriglobia bacterium]|nr:hypothetical protein [Terriglobia bacterium]
MELAHDGGLRNAQAASRTTEDAFLKDRQEKAKLFQPYQNSDAKFALLQSLTGINGISANL